MEGAKLINFFHGYYIYPSTMNEFVPRQIRNFKWRNALLRPLSRLGQGE